MLRRILTGIGFTIVAATLAYAQDAPQTPGPRGVGAPQPAGAGRGGRGGAGGGSPKLPTQAQWDNMPQAGKDYIAKAVAEAGSDPDLQFDEKIFCQADGGATGRDRATLGVPNSRPHMAAFPSPNPAIVMPPAHLFDNFWWFGNSGVGSWLVTSNDGYILFDTMDNAQEARDIVVGGMKKVGLDPNKIKYVIFGHWHLDHTGGGHYIQSNFHPRAIMGATDWPLYFKAMRQANAPTPTGQGAHLDDKTPMTHDIDAEDGMKVTVGDVTATIYEMTGHTPGSIGMILPVKYQGKEHPILVVTAGTDVPNINSFVGGYEHIWDIAERDKVESVIQVHPNTNMNTLARTKYMTDHYPAAENPLLYGVDRTRRYIEIMRDCTQARMVALGWE